MKNDEEDYTYKCRPQQDLLAELFKDELNAISKLSRNVYDPHTGSQVNNQERALKKLYNDKKQEINDAINADCTRVLNNMLNIPLNQIERISANTLVQRVSSGWIYFYEIYNDHMSASVINVTSTFVPSTTGSSHGV